MVNVDGTAVTRLTECNDEHPTWSPNGTSIAFASASSQRGPGNYEIYVFSAGDSQARRLTDLGGASSRAADWSPDGRRIALFSRRDGNDEIYVVNVDGTGLARLTTDPAPDFDPDWSPDGNRIVFERLQASDTSGDLFVMNADGTAVTNLANNPKVDGYPNRPGRRPGRRSLSMSSKGFPPRPFWPA